MLDFMQKSISAAHHGQSQDQQTHDQTSWRRSSRRHSFTDTFSSSSSSSPSNFGSPLATTTTTTMHHLNLDRLLTRLRTVLHRRERERYTQIPPLAMEVEMELMPTVEASRSLRIPTTTTRPQSWSSPCPSKRQRQSFRQSFIALAEGFDSQALVEAMGKLEACIECSLTYPNRWA